MLGKLPAELCALIAPVFAQASSRFAAFAYVTALLTAPGDRKSCSQLGEQADCSTGVALIVIIGTRIRPDPPLIGRSGGIFFMRAGRCS